MHKLLGLSLFFLLSINTLYAENFQYVRKIILKKDELKRILVKYDAVKKNFQFRWTLFVNDGLVVHRSYGEQQSQNMLYTRYQNRSFRVELKPRGSDSYNVPYILITFKGFDLEKNEAKFELYLSDIENLITLDYLK